ncbi:MAG TPA: hypothetical protein VMG60_07290 [Burkholderiaceae bacterium]|nr:hypothetical protein [Burkholderiaceae bacterium]
MLLRQSFVLPRLFALPRHVQALPLDIRCSERKALDTELRTHARAFAAPMIAITSLVVAGFLAACFAPL